MIHRATFQNFKALRDVTVTFDRRLTVLVGPNGCGKSSVLKVIEYLGCVTGGREITEKAAEVLNSAKTFSGVPGEQQVFELDVKTPDGVIHHLRYSMAVTPQNQQQKAVTEYRRTISGGTPEVFQRDRKSVV